MNKAILLIIKAIRKLAVDALPFWRSNDIQKILDEAEQALNDKER